MTHDAVEDTFNRLSTFYNHMVERRGGANVMRALAALLLDIGRQPFVFEMLRHVMAALTPMHVQEDAAVVAEELPQAHGHGSPGVKAPRELDA